jgi:membrane protein
MTETAAAARHAAAVARHWLGRFWHFVYYVLSRFNDDGCLAAAGALSYTTLVSLVPLLAISLAVFSAFPIFDKLRGQALAFIFDAFVPRIGGTVEGYISTFAASAGKTTALGVVVLAVTAIMLLATIEARLDAIWRVHVPRGWVARITVYWTLLTLGPLLFGMALSISTSLHVLTIDLGMSEDVALPFLGPLPALAGILPVLLTSLGLTLFYCLIPHCPVRWRDGLLGGAAAGALLEICRFGFTLFIDHYNSYEPIYGAIAVLPIFLLWVYLSWTVVLFGAEIAAALPLWGIDEALGATPEITDLEMALRLLEALTAQIHRGGTARLRSLARMARSSTGVVGDCLNRLCGAGLVAATLDGGFVLARDLSKVSLQELETALDQKLPHPQRRRSTRRTVLDERLALVRQAEREALAAPVSSFLAADPP